ncbi:MAG: ATP-binding cassette domain-containing protein [Kiloniellales bacterium]
MTAETTPLVALRDVSVGFDGRWVLDHVSMQVAAGEIVTLIGLNGSGKTTLARTLLGLIRPDRGAVVTRPRLRVGYTPQRFLPDPALPLTVARFLALGASGPSSRLAGILDEVGAGRVVNGQLASLSGGELHRVLLARALLRRPDLLVLDEPVSGVDVAGQSDLYRLIARIRDRYGCGVVLVSHDLHLVMAATDTVICLNHHVCCTGRPSAVLQDPDFVSLFGRRTAEALAVYTHRHDHHHDPAGGVVPVADRPAGGDR